MASLYGYITIAQLQLYSTYDYSTIRAAYTDTVVESWITQAERIVNKIKGQTFTGTIPDDVIMATTEAAARIANNQMALDKVEGFERVELIDDDLIFMATPKDSNFYSYGIARDDSSL